MNAMVEGGVETVGAQWGGSFQRRSFQFSDFSFAQKPLATGTFLLGI
jgi:hypothetical protein